jgi:UDP-N-acetylglucosamine:LPS N-acetylglucosamine transferase
VKKVLAVASGGGHWVQLLRLKAAWQGHDVAYVTVQADYRAEVPGSRFHAVTDATRWSRWKLLRMIVEVGVVVLRERPEVIVTTGAAPGLVALRLGKWLGARTVWIDSIANVEALSLSGTRALKFADLCLTQWPHLAKPGGPQYVGAVL